MRPKAIGSTIKVKTEGLVSLKVFKAKATEKIIELTPHVRPVSKCMQKERNENGES